MQITNKLKVYIGVVVIDTALAAAALRAGWKSQGAVDAFRGQAGPGMNDLIIGLVFTVVLILSGYLLSKSDRDRHYRGNSALLYHLYCSVLLTAASVIGWLFLTYFGWRYLVWVLVLGWGSYGIHWLAVRNSLKGIDAKTAFK